MKKQTAFERFIEDLTVEMRKDSYFDEFKFYKSRAAFIRKYDWGWKSLFFRRHGDFYYFMVHPMYRIRYNILQKWFEPFEQKELKLVRQTPTVTIQGPEVLDMPMDYVFIHEKNEYRKLFPKCSRQILTVAKITFDEYDSLEDCYIKKILPQFENEEIPFKSWGESAPFYFLAAVKLCDPDRYEEFKPKAINTVRWRMNQGFEWSAYYYNHLDEIFDRLENGELKA